LKNAAADSMHMALAALGGVSSLFDIDHFALIKFYSQCGLKYLSLLGEVEMASVCFDKGIELANDADGDENAKLNVPNKFYQKALFDLHIGRAQCAWERGELDHACVCLSQAKRNLEDLPEEREFTARYLLLHITSKLGAATSFCEFLLIKDFHCLFSR